MNEAITTLNELLRHSITRFTCDTAVGYAREDGRTSWLSTAEVAERIRAASLGLASLGVSPGDRVALLAENRWEWMVTDFAILSAGATHVPVHPGLTAEQIAFILKDSGAGVALASTPALAARMLEACRQAGTVDTLVTFDEPAPSDEPAPAGFLEPLTFGRLLERGRTHGERHPGLYRKTRDAVRPEDLASIIYTSGTTGDPKGVMLTHANFASNVTACCSVYDFLPSDVGLSFLPLCHVFQRVVDYCYYNSGCSVLHVPDLAKVAEAIVRHRPTTFAAVPRLYEKLYSRIQDSVPPGKRRLFDWAVGVGIRALRARLAGRGPGPWLSLQRALADRLVHGKIRQRLGGRLRFTISGGAPLARELAEFYNGIGISVYEGYGLTETSPVITLNSAAGLKPGTVGRAIPGVEVCLADDGEVLTRGPHVMKGYWNAPRRTAATIDTDGWLHTGDVGKLDDDGFLSITDRKKEIIVTAQGKNIAPQPIENALKQLSLIQQAAVVGDRRPYLVALIVPDFEVLANRAAAMGINGGSLSEQLRHPQLAAAMEKQIDGIRERFARHEQIRRFALVERDFSQEEDELTPTLKLKRRIIEAHFADQIESLYESSPTPEVKPA